MLSRSFLSCAWRFLIGRSGPRTIRLGWIQMASRGPSIFKKAYGSWANYRYLTQLEINFHYEGRRRDISYDEAMSDVYDRALEALKEAQERGLASRAFTHGHSP